MRRIIISTYDSLGNPVYSGGGASVIHEIAKRLTKEDDLLILAGNFPGGKNEVIDGVEYRRVGWGIFGPKIGQVLFNFLLPWYVKKMEFDLWVENFTPPFSASLVPILTNKPVIGLAHMLSGADMKRKYKIPFDLVESWGLKLYKNFIAINEGDREKILNTNAKANVVLIPNGISLPKIKDRQKKHVLFLGRIEVDQKGLDMLIRAYSAYIGDIKLPLVIAGSGNVKEEKILRKIIRKSGLTKQVFLVGRVDGKEKSKLMEEALFMVVPSRYETFSLVALEAISYGIPLVTFNIPGLSWVPSTSRVMAKEFDWDYLGRLMVRLTRDSKLRKRMSRASLKLANSFTWEKVYGQYLNCFEKILAN